MTDYTILHLDDSMAFLEEIQYLVGMINKEKKGSLTINYTEVETVEKAKAKLKKQTFNLLLLDLMLEGQNTTDTGVEFIKNIKTEHPDQKIMVLSARIDSFLQEQLQEFIVYYQSKAFSPRDFQNRLVFILENPKGELWQMK